MGGDEDVDSSGPDEGANSPGLDEEENSPKSEEPSDFGNQAPRQSAEEPSPQTPAEQGFISNTTDGPDEAADTDRVEAADQFEAGREPDRPNTHHTSGDPEPRAGMRSAYTWFRETDSQWIGFLRETLVSVLIVIAVGFLLFAISGVWPPLVAVESNSMDPHLQKGDLVLVMAEDRLSPEYDAAGTGIVTAKTGAEQDYNRFGGPGDVIVYQPYGSDSATPIIHRAHLYVESGENWYDRADPDVIQADSCAELGACPAPSDGFITKGDNPTTNNYYDQERGISSVVKPEWVRGTAVVRIPWVGWIRLAASELQLPGPSATIGVVPAV